MLIITGSSWKVLVMEAKLVSVYEGLLEIMRMVLPFYWFSNST